MVEIPDRLECLFSAAVEEASDSYTIEVPKDEAERGAISAGETYRVVLLENNPSDESEPSHTNTAPTPTSTSTPTPPVSTGDTREVTIETLGDQGDGIAKIERGYVLIVPGVRPDDEVTVEITQVRENVAFADVRDQPNNSES
jgi:predicted RNA-binding protein with TRAM domain